MEMREVEKVVKRVCVCVCVCVCVPLEEGGAGGRLG